MRFQYSGLENNPDSMMPRLALTLYYEGHEDRALDVIGIVDSGSTVNVLPYQVGLNLGARWEEQTQSVALTGVLGRFDARALFVWATHPQLTTEPIPLIFAWTQAANAPLLFGQMNFFAEFDVCFYRADAVFEVTRRNST
jgi:hypothetical protein